eukprot:scaffold90967_cov22-Tisochrysis_lutea.AAC.1
MRSNQLHSMPPYPSAVLLCVKRRRRAPLLLEDEGQPPPQALQNAEQLRRGGDFIPNFSKSDQQARLRACVHPFVDCFCGQYSQ